MTDQEPGTDADGTSDRPGQAGSSAPEATHAYPWDPGTPISPDPIIGSGAPHALPGAPLAAPPGDRRLALPGDPHGDLPGAHPPGSARAPEGRAPEVRADPSATEPRGPRLLLRVAVLGMAIVLVAGAALALGALNRGLHSPRAQVAAYLTALEEGRFSDAAAHLAGPDGVTNGLLLTDAIGASTTA